MRQVFDAPERGDVLLITAASGTKAGRICRRPMAVVSPQAYNARAGLALLCPIVSRIRGYPFEVPVPPGLPVTGAVLSDQAVSVDWRAHRAEKICSLPSGVIEEVAGKLGALLS